MPDTNPLRPTVVEPASDSLADLLRRAAAATDNGAVKQFLEALSRGERASSEDDPRPAVGAPDGAGPGLETEEVNAERVPDCK
jgi:hypothetical protein